MKNAYIKFVTKNGGFINADFIKAVLDMFERHGYKIKNFNCGGNANNMPIYLLGEIEEHYGETIVFAIGAKENDYNPMIFVDNKEIDTLMEALENAEKDENAWEICKRVHKILREE